MDREQEQALAEAVGRAIARKRVEAGLTQEQVAEQLALGREAVARVERGTAIPTIVRLVELAELFGCRTEEFLSGASTREDDQAVAIAGALRGVSLKDRQMLMEWLTTLAQRLRKGA
ncbi:helix-turn-helix domain-containing protein [Paraburkholderia susongensis]|uniref:Helix-turn-helix n=1 Tax=Paraburkholderia susongensis TaxID=1515439 RepID=A0A1X7ICY8_9BURK|nr:helix-turn-helix transcriptional regulator [Paraburkholderia susongensis]SMG12518.1 Helix-turn-helix [Paraburkholderia susongensis]